MNIQIQTPRLKYKEELAEVINQKLNKAFGVYPYITNCKVYLKVEEQEQDQPCEMEVYLHLVHKEIFASEKAGTFEEALPGVISKLKRQLERYKQKVYTNP